MAQEVPRPHHALAKIAEYADALCDHSFEGWSLAHCIREMAKGRLSPTEADARMEELEG